MTSLSGMIVPGYNEVWACTAEQTDATGKARSGQSQICRSPILFLAWLFWIALNYGCRNLASLQ